MVCMLSGLFNFDGQLHQIIIIALCGKIVPNNVLIEVVACGQAVVLCVLQKLQAVFVNIGVALVVVDGNVVAAMVKSRISNARLAQFFRVDDSVELVVFVAVVCY